MKTIIYYFSGTGNSYVAAKNIAEKMENADIVSIAKVIKNDDIDFSADIIGIVYPVYMFGLPLIVRDFAKRINSNNKYIFSVATCGGWAGNANNQLKKILERNNIVLSAGFIIDMPGNYTPLYGAPPVKKQNKLFAKKDERIIEIVDIIKNKSNHKIENSFFIMRILGAFFYRFGSEKIHSMDKDFWTDNNCNGCGICDKVCPVENIDFVESKPHWKSNCQQCMACLQWCPEHSIQYKKSTIGRKRYTNPEIKIDDIIIDK